MNRDRILNNRGHVRGSGRKVASVARMQPAFGLTILIVVTLFFVPPAPVVSRADTTATPDWLEPRGLNVVELVGRVPDEYLQGTIISYDDWHGIVVYESGQRVGNHVEITTTLYPRYNPEPWAEGGYLTSFGCLGQAPHYDHMGSVVPASVLRVYDSAGTELTSKTVLMTITDVGLSQPSAGSNAAFRYPRIEYGGPDLPLPLEADGLHLPSNAGCWIRIQGGNYYPLTGVFTLDLSPAVYAKALGTQTASFQSYIGEGWLGLFQPLMNQLRNKYGDRHGRIPLSIPAGANYFLLKFPPMPGDPYTDTSITNKPLNTDRLTGGTYRLSDGELELSTNMIFSAGFPLERAWRDTDQAGSVSFLPLMDAPPYLATPEYVIPAGMTYNSCFVNGGCPESILQQIYDAQMSLEIVYLRVDPPSTGQWIPVKMVGPARLATDAVAMGTEALQGVEVAPGMAVTGTHVVFLPLVTVVRDEQPPEPPPPPPGCPCGWFDPVGRMLGFTP